jgi:hypothetical protein
LLEFEGAKVLAVTRSTLGEVLERASEQVLGDILVTAQLSMGYERLRLYFTDRRIIVGHLGKVGAGSVAPTFVLGSIGSALGGLFGRGREGREKSASQYPSPDVILAKHRSNFAIFFEEIVSVDLTLGAYKNAIAILSKNDKYDFSSTARFEKVRLLFQNALEERVRLHRER